MLEKTHAGLLFLQITMRLHFRQDCIPVGYVHPLVARISQHAMCWGSLLRVGVSAPGGSCPEGMFAPGGGWSLGVPASGPGGCLPLVPGGCIPPVNRFTDMCKNMTLPQLRCGR